MTPAPVPAIVREAIDILFGVYGQVVIAATYKRESGSPPVVTHSAPVKMLVLPVAVRDTDAMMVYPGDERILIREGELATVPNPQSGDYLVETTSSLRRNVMVSQHDSTRQLWTFHARKVFS